MRRADVGAMSYYRMWTECLVRLLTSRDAPLPSATNRPRPLLSSAGSTPPVDRSGPRRRPSSSASEHQRPASLPEIVRHCDSANITSHPDIVVAVLEFLQLLAVPAVQAGSPRSPSLPTPSLPTHRKSVPRPGRQVPHSDAALAASCQMTHRCSSPARATAFGEMRASKVTNRPWRWTAITNK